MADASAEKSILILGDDNRVLKVVQSVLPSEYRIVKIDAIHPDRQSCPISTCNCDLIILALSSCTSEPIVVLGRVFPTIEFGRVPILISSDRPFPSDERIRIFHIEFPFSAGCLLARVREIMQQNNPRMGAPAADGHEYFRDRTGAHVDQGDPAGAYRTARM